jgi:transposase
MPSTMTPCATMYTHYLGVDISKLTLDLCLLDKDANVLVQQQIPNTASAWIALQDLFQKYGIATERVLICGEHTGMYTYHLLCWVAKDAHVWVESGKRIKNSQGILRGKNDAKDALRIAQYALRFADQAQLWQPTPDALQQIIHLKALRDRLLAAFNALNVPIKEQKDFMQHDHFQTLQALNTPVTESIKAQIEKVEQQIQQTIEGDQNLKNQLELLDSIPGIATKTAIGLIVKTKGFTAFKNARQFACHAGIVPFDYTSGSSIKGKTKVSVHADKELKTILHLAALAAVKTKGVIQDYYKRKQEQGKPKMSALNAVRNKIALIAFAVIKNNKLFDKNYEFSFEIS